MARKDGRDQAIAPVGDTQGPARAPADPEGGSTVPAQSVGEFSAAPPRRRAALLAILLIVLVGFGGFWAGRATVGGQEVAADLDRADLVADVVEISVGRELTLNVSVARPQRPLAVNALSGVVTSTAERSRVAVGDVLYRVAGVPVRVVEGDLPFYRPLQLGDRGRDVRQLRDALVSLGYLDRSSDVFDAATQAGIESWQRALGMTVTGAVRQGELVAVPALPTSITLDPAAFAGALLSGGETVVYAAIGAPQFTLIVSTDQARLIPEGAKVTIPIGDRDLRAIVAESSATAGGEVEFQLTAPTGGEVCSDECKGLTEARVSVLSSIEVVPKVTGPGVPVAAITTAPDGTTSVLVVGASGADVARDVEVLASQDGTAVVEGIEVGEQVRVFASGDSSSSAASQSPQAGAVRLTSGSLHSLDKA